MENKINVAELLKDCPPGMELDCTMYEGVVTFVKIDEYSNYPIVISVQHNGDITICQLTQTGQPCISSYTKCVIFPKGKTTWEGFVPPCKFKDGDILISVHDNPFIFKETHNDKICGCYCGIAQNGELGIESPHWTSNYNLQLATEEEKQKLFDVIKANGLKWNSETKTLEKLMEPNFEDGDILSSRYGNPIILKAHLPKFKVGDRIKYRDEEIIYRIVKITEDTYELDNHHSIPISLEYEYMYDLVPNKFDIFSLKPFDKVLVRDNDNGRWDINFFELYDNTRGFYPIRTLGGTTYKYCIPYEGNEHLIGKTDDCIEYYKTWEE